MADWELLPLFNVASYVLHNVRQVDAARDAVRVLDLVKVRGGARKSGEGWCVMSGVVDGARSALALSTGSQHWPFSSSTLNSRHTSHNTHLGEYVKLFEQRHRQPLHEK